MEWRVDPGSETSPSRQIVEVILDAVAAGALAPGDRLLSVRALAAEALVNPNTVSRAYRDLEAMGVVEGVNGLGVFVTDAGPGVARTARGRATLDAFRRAAHEALRAGHDEEVLAQVLRDAGVPAR